MPLTCYHISAARNSMRLCCGFGCSSVACDRRAHSPPHPPPARAHTHANLRVRSRSDLKLRTQPCICMHGAESSEYLSDTAQVSTSQSPPTLPPAPLLPPPFLARAFSDSHFSRSLPPHTPPSSLCRPRRGEAAKWEEIEIWRRGSHSPQTRETARLASLGISYSQ